MNCHTIRYNENNMENANPERIPFVYRYGVLRWHIERKG